MERWNRNLKVIPRKRPIQASDWFLYRNSNIVLPKELSR
jgi:hypothetical protein